MTRRPWQKWVGCGSWCLAVMIYDLFLLLHHVSMPPLEYALKLPTISRVGLLSDFGIGRRHKECLDHMNYTTVDNITWHQVEQACRASHQFLYCYTRSSCHTTLAAAWGRASKLRLYKNKRFPVLSARPAGNHPRISKCANVPLPPPPVVHLSSFVGGRPPRLSSMYRYIWPVRFGSSPRVMMGVVEADPFGSASALRLGEPRATS